MCYLDVFKLLNAYLQQLKSFKRCYLNTLTCKVNLKIKTMRCFAMEVRIKLSVYNKNNRLLLAAIFECFYSNAFVEVPITNSGSKMIDFFRLSLFSTASIIHAAAALPNSSLG